MKTKYSTNGLRMYVHDSTDHICIFERKPYCVGWVFAGRFDVKGAAQWVVNHAS